MLSELASMILLKFVDRFICICFMNLMNSPFFNCLRNMTFNMRFFRERVCVRAHSCICGHACMCMYVC
jgi:hypothetical protein